VTSSLLGDLTTFSNGLRHAIQPSVEYRAIPGQWGRCREHAHRTQSAGGEPLLRRDRRRGDEGSPSTKGWPG
jgi:hypothetical protein